MKKLITLTLLAVLLAASIAPVAHADWDAKLEAQEAAKRRAEQQEQARKRAAANRMKDEAEMKAIRGYFGKEGNGKSDEELKHLYQERQAAALRQAAAYQAPGSAQARKDADMRKQAEANMKAMYGKSFKDLEGMSEKELDAFARDVEQKYTK
jgi:hypothetical protein